MLDLRDRQLMSIALSKGGAKKGAREIDLVNPLTWEFSGFSQNGEDGIIDVLLSQLVNKNYYFIEIGSADGVQNNSSWLVLVEQYNGLMIEGSSRLADRAKRLIINHSIGVECLNMYVNSENIQELKSKALHINPDVFSLDIDGVDYYVAKAIMDAGFRPKIFVVEYNSVYGPDRSMTIPYRHDFVFSNAHSTQLYYGVSISAWRKLFTNHGYKFIAVDRQGVNAFFVDPTCFNSEFLSKLKSPEFIENAYQLKKFKGAHEKQFKLVADQQYVTI